jgi:predicted transglutaminase-like cysteine proteinase
MSNFAKKRQIACGAVFLLSSLCVQPIETDVREIGIAAETTGAETIGQNAVVPQTDKVVIALADFAQTPVIAGPTPLGELSPAWPAPARFFTINQVLAKGGHISSKSPAVRLASANLAEPMSDVALNMPMQARSNEPFGLFTFQAPAGLLRTKWSKVDSDIQAEAPALAACRKNPDRCTPATARFVAIITEAARHQGRAKLEIVNQRINSAIHYTSDFAQWGTADVWSAPLDTDGKGSFNTGLGDCEDYAIAKYVALREAGVAAEDLRLLLVRDTNVRLDHAVLAAREDGHWLILDNRWTKLMEDAETNQFMPLFAIDAQGVKLFAAPYAAKEASDAGHADVRDQIFSVGGNAFEFTEVD